MVPDAELIVKERNLLFVTFHQEIVAEQAGDDVP